MARKAPSKDYYTAAQAKAILGITDGKLYNYVDNKTLERIIPPGKKQGVYRRSQVDQLARDLNIFTSTRDTKVTFGKASVDDIPICVELSRGSFPGIQQGLATVETRLAWMSKNSELFYILKRDDDIVGYTALIPMKPEKIEKILKNEEFMKDIMPEEIEIFEINTPLHIYVMTMVTKPGISRQEKRFYGVRLIGGLITTLADLKDRGINIIALYGRSETVDGIRALKHMGFEEIPSVTNYKNFLLKMDGPGTRIIQRYVNQRERK